MSSPSATGLLMCPGFSQASSVSPGNGLILLGQPLT
jgi:hypothetical protein